MQVHICPWCFFSAKIVYNAQLLISLCFTSATFYCLLKAGLKPQTTTGEAETKVQNKAYLTKSTTSKAYHSFERQNWVWF